MLNSPRAVQVIYKGEALVADRDKNGKAVLKRYLPEHNFFATVKKFNERSAKKLGV
jgi:hypothetical protein